MMYFTVRNNRRTGLNDERFGFILFQIPQVGPNANIGAQGRVVYLLDAQKPEIGQELFPLGKIRFYRRIYNQGDGKTGGQIRKKSVNIIQVIPRPMFTDGNTGPADNTLGAVNLNLDIILRILIDQISHFDGTLAGTSITTYTQILIDADNLPHD
jgi:hypothetical protein